MRAARSYVGTPFQEQGRSRHGVDCIGPLVLAARDCGIQIEDDPRYPGRPAVDLLTKKLKKHLAIVRGDWRSAMRIGDIVRFKDRNITHVGVVGDKHQPFSVIHVTSMTGCVEVILDPNLVHSVYRYPRWPSSR